MYSQNNKFSEQCVSPFVARRRRPKLGTYRASLGLGPLPDFPPQPPSAHKGIGSHRKTISSRCFLKGTPKSNSKPRFNNAFKENTCGPSSAKEKYVNTSADKRFIEADPDVTGVFSIEDLQSAKKQTDRGGRSQQLNGSSNNTRNMERCEIESRSDENVRTVSRNLMIKSPFCKQLLKEKNDNCSTEISNAPIFKSPSLIYTKQFYSIKKYAPSSVEPVMKSFKSNQSFTVKPSIDKNKDHPLGDFEPGRKSISVLVNKSPGLNVGNNSRTHEQSESLIARNGEKIENVSSIEQRSSRRSIVFEQRSTGFIDFTVKAEEQNTTSMIVEEKNSRISVVDKRRSTTLCDFPLAFSTNYKEVKEENDMGTFTQDKYSRRSIVDKRSATFADGTVAPSSCKGQTAREDYASLVRDENYPSRNVMEKISAAFSDFTVAPLHEEKSEEESGDRTITMDERPSRKSVMDERPSHKSVMDKRRSIMIPSAGIEKEDTDSVDTSKSRFTSTLLNESKREHHTVEATNESNRSLIDEISSQTSGAERLDNTSVFSSEDEAETVTFMYNESVCNETLTGDFSIKSKTPWESNEEGPLHQPMCKPAEQLSGSKNTSRAVDFVAKLNAILESHKGIVQRSESFSKQRNTILEKMRLEQNEFLARQKELLADVRKREDEIIKEQNDNFIDIFDNIGDLVSEISSGTFQNKGTDEDETITEDEVPRSAVKTRNGDDSMMNNTLCRTPANVRQQRSNFLYSQLKSDFSFLKTPKASTVKNTDLLNSTLNRTLLTPRSMSFCIQEQVNQLFD